MRILSVHRAEIQGAPCNLPSNAWSKPIARYASQPQPGSNSRTKGEIPSTHLRCPCLAPSHMHNAMHCRHLTGCCFRRVLRFRGQRGFSRPNCHPHPQPQNSLLRTFRLQPGLEWKFLLRRTWSGAKLLPLQFPGLSLP